MADKIRTPDRTEALRDPDTLRLERPLDARLLRVPGRIELRDGLLEWRWLPGAKTAQVRAGILEGFLKLADASNDAILAYARDWGPLGICPDHELPCTHSQDCAPIASEASAGMQGHESVDRWRDWSLEARAILELAAALLQSRGGVVEWAEVEAYRVMFGHRALRPRKPQPKRVKFAGKWWTTLDVPEKRPTPGEKTSVDWRWIQFGIARWLEYGDVRTHLEWLRRPNELAVRLGTASEGLHTFRCRLFGALAGEMLGAVMGKGLGWCPACGEPYRPERRLRSDRANYCPRCRHEGASGRRAQQRYRASTKFRKRSR